MLLRNVNPGVCIRKPILQGKEPFQLDPRTLCSPQADTKLSSGQCWDAHLRVSDERLEY